METAKVNNVVPTIFAVKDQPRLGVGRESRRLLMSVVSAANLALSSAEMRLNGGVVEVSDLIAFTHQG